MPDSIFKVNRDIQRDQAFKHLRDSGSRFVPGEGEIVTPKLFIIGEAPGEQEDRNCRPFCGASGNTLDGMLYEIKIKRADCYITNVLHYRPPRNRRPTDEEVEDALPYLRREWKCVRPRVTVMLGGTAIDVINPRKRPSHDHGQPFDQAGHVFVPMVHPAYVLRGGLSRTEYITDWQAVKRALEGTR